VKTKIALLLCTITGFLVLSAGVQFRKDDIGAYAAVGYFSAQTGPFASSSNVLMQAVKAIDTDSASVINARKALLKCRLSYKSISFFTSYFFPSETAMYNAAPKYEVEEPELELVEPMGLQQIEALLFEDNVYAHKEELIAQADAFNSSAADLKTLLYQFSANDSQVMESLRIELVRIITLYISGYDAPLLKSGISEALESSKSMELVLKPYLMTDDTLGKQLAVTLKSAITYLNSNQDFDSFNRMEYLVDYALPLQEQLSQFTKKLNLEMNTMLYVNSQAKNLFSRDFLKTWDSIAPSKRKELATLGKQLFFDQGLSGNLKVSCASCHRPEQYFSDGNIVSPSLLKDSVLKRNTPSLLYAGFQHAQFWDGRAKSLKAQIKDVLFNPLEMGGNHAAIVGRIAKSAQYAKSFNDLANDKAEAYVERIAMAISAFVADLTPLNSAFDRYLAGDKKAMNTQQVKGFNLFMGKAQCGTCHFAPYFNALVPPLYDVTEVEVLGTTKDDDLLHPQYDQDPGRYNLYKIHYYQQAFKTPTVRNTEKTAPYMHNGAFKTLESVIEFYNKGGATGLGLKTPDQTLSSRPLNLSKPESDALVQFIHSLSDSKISQQHENN
jgi:cytochrome c peroxidase